MFRVCFFLSFPILQTVGFVIGVAVIARNRVLFDDGNRLFGHCRIACHAAITSRNPSRPSKRRTLAP